MGVPEISSRRLAGKAEMHLVVAALVTGLQQVSEKVMSCHYAVDSSIDISMSLFTQLTLSIEVKSL